MAIFSILGRFAATLAITGLAFWLIYQLLIPQWLFALETPQNILIVPTNIEESGDVLLFVHLEADEQNQKIHLISGADKVNVVGGYGEYQLQNIYHLLKLDNKDDQFIAAAFNNALGVSIDQVLPVETLTARSLEKGIASKDFLERARSDIKNFKNYLRLHYLTKNLGEAQIITIEKFTATASRYQTLGVNTARDCPVAVINTTNKSGLASKVSGIIEENGGLVVRVSSQPKNQDHSSLYFSQDTQELCQPLINLITRIFPASLELIAAHDNLTSEYRSELILFLGEDAAQNLSQPIQ